MVKSGNNEVLGVVVKVQHAGTGAELDVSDYGSW
jgi:hypothetical protein